MCNEREIWNIIKKTMSMEMVLGLKHLSSASYLKLNIWCETYRFVL